MKTEQVLNRAEWVNAYGEILEVSSLEQDYLQNILMYLYKHRDRYWLNCKDASLIELFRDGDEFFQLVIRKSTIWTSIIEQLTTEDKGFNFEFDLPE